MMITITWLFASYHLVPTLARRTANSRQRPAIHLAEISRSAVELPSNVCEAGAWINRWLSPEVVYRGR